MMAAIQQFLQFVWGSVRLVSRGSRGYLAWVTALVAVIAVGAFAYVNQTQYGLVTTNMRDQVSWGFYIGNFAFLVGVAAAAVIVVIPAYVYRWPPLREVVLLGELMAIAAIIMCILFVTVDVGRPERVWHMMPLVGEPNFPYSLLIWDILVLTTYFATNVLIVTYLVYMAYRGRKYNPAFILPIIFLSIPMAISIHTVTAFLFMGLKARPFWNTAILAPRFISSAFVSGPALLLLIFMVLRRVRPIEISDAAIRKLGELLAYTMATNLFFLGCEVFREFYAKSAHSIHAEFQWFGLGHGPGIAVYTWFALACEITALVIFVMPELRNRTPVLAAGCALAFSGAYIEKGLGLLLPGMTPDMMGETYRYNPSLNEVLIGAGIWGVGALSFTLMAKVATAVSADEFRYRHVWEAPPGRRFPNRRMAAP